MICKYCGFWYSNCLVKKCSIQHQNLPTLAGLLLLQAKWSDCLLKTCANLYHDLFSDPVIGCPFHTVSWPKWKPVIIGCLLKSCGKNSHPKTPNDLIGCLFHPVSCPQREPLAYLSETDRRQHRQSVTDRVVCIIVSLTFDHEFNELKMVHRGIWTPFTCEVQLTSGSSPHKCVVYSPFNS